MSQTEDTHTDPKTLSALIARILDDCIRIPGTNWRFGLDPIIGLLPGVGDTSTATASMVIVVQGLRKGIPRVALSRMLINILINTLFGALPLVGDAFSVWFKSNRRNYDILNSHAAKERSSTIDWIIVGTFIVILLALIVLIASFSVWIFSELIRWMAQI